MASPVKFAARSLPMVRFFCFSTISPVTRLPRANPMMYPKLGFNTYQMPPPSAKIGSPTSPSTAYNPTLMAPSLPPMIRPASMVNRNCSVNGTTGTGTLMNAPTAMSAVNSAHMIISLVVIFLPIFPGSKLFSM